MLMATRQAQRSTIGISSVRSLRVQTIVALILAIILPALVYFEGNTVQIVRSHTAFNTLLGASIATFAAYFMADRVTAFPGKGQLSYILPTYGISYALVAAVILLGRIPYSAGILLINFAATTGVQILVSAVAERQIGYRVFVAPGGRVEQLEAVDGLDTT